MVKMGTVWDRTTEFLGDHLAALLPLALLTIFVPTSLQGSLSLLNATAPPALKLGLALVTLVLWLLMLWGQLAITAMATGPRDAGPYATATARLLPAIGVLFVAGVILALLFLPATIVLAATGFDFRTLSNPASAAMPVAARLPIGIVILVTLPIAAWLFARIYVLLTPVVVVERRGLRAIARAFALSRGLALRIFGVVLLYAIVSGIAELAAKTVFGSVFELVADGDGPFSLAKVLTAIVVGAVSTAFLVLDTVFCAKLYLATSGSDDPILL